MCSVVDVVVVMLGGPRCLVCCCVKLATTLGASAVWLLLLSLGAGRPVCCCLLRVTVDAASRRVDKTAEGSQSHMGSSSDCADTALALATH